MRIHYFKSIAIIFILFTQYSYAATKILYGTPTIDGNLTTNEWPDASHIKMVRFYGPDQYTDLWLQWDENNLYIAGKLQDHTLFEDRGGSNQSYETWQDDSLEILIHPSSSTLPNQINHYSRIMAFSINALTHRFDRGALNSSEGITTGLEAIGNTTAKINFPIFNRVLPVDWACTHIQPKPNFPAVQIRYVSSTEGSINHAQDRDKNWLFETAIPWDLVGTKFIDKIVGANCALGQGLVPEKLSSVHGTSLKINFFRVSDDDGGNVLTKQGPTTTDRFGNITPDGTLADEWMVFKGNRYSPREWEEFILFDQRKKLNAPQFSSTELDITAIGPYRARLNLIAPDNNGKAAESYDIRIKSGSADISEAIWNTMSSFENSYQPATPGQKQQLDVLGLQPEQTYTIAIRAKNSSSDLSQKIIFGQVKMLGSGSPFVTVSPTGRNLVLTNNTPFPVVGETVLIPWKPIRALYNGVLCDDHWPVGVHECENGTAKGKLRNYFEEKVFQYQLNGHTNSIHITSPAEMGEIDKLKAQGIELTQLEGIEVAEQYFATLKENGVNVLTIFVESLDLKTTPIFLETAPGQFNPHVLEFFDSIVALAEKNNVYLIMRLYDTYYYKDDEYASGTNEKKWSDTYWSTHLGKASPDNFFDEDLYTYHQERIKTLVERYKAIPNILGWDLLNEVDNKQRFNTASYEKRKLWLENMVNYTKSIDPHHLVFFSFLTWDSKDDDYYRASIGEHVYGEEINQEKYIGMDADTAYRLDNVDIALPHGYYAHTSNPKLAAKSIDDLAPLEMARGIRYGYYQIKDGRPILDGESGPSPLFIERYDSSFTEQQDKNNFMHKMWLHFTAGGTGANLRWPIQLSNNTSNMLIGQDWRDLLAIFKDSVKDIPWRGNYQHVYSRTAEDNQFISIRYDGRNLVSYVFNPNNSKIHTIHLTELDEGFANIKVINPVNGEVLLEKEQMVGGDSYPITLKNEFDSSIAIIVSRTTVQFFNSGKSQWSKANDTHIKLFLNAYPFIDEDIYLWFEDALGNKYYILDLSYNYTMEKQPIVRNLTLPSTYLSGEQAAFINIPTIYFPNGDYKFGWQIGTTLREFSFSVVD